MTEAQLAMVLVGFVLQLVVVIAGIVGLAFTLWRWISAMRTDLGERLATVEAHVSNLREDRGGVNDKLRRQVR